ncbi:MAG: helix-turn-helix transcriptional regulator [Caldilineaceae bacterium]|nr:helix-turn-helix transcriptional regulator [Caldilineaceae bacterium]MCB0093851.1 helix-turn-helix transcriptional regulator [Caldilineaceae bacterium]MCB0096359.1 helix-turn-helix transcriptional regulator [Caldilineaceae bacterium]MCB0141455.1 helix-turn-helix transcriptional regulator [Caldilineaceae bacterium]MCB9149305.1 helix-turn-helix transcriptional regulator [Caldilineaceae bacterium]
MNVQIIEKNGKPEWAVLPYEEFKELIHAAEDWDDVRLYDEAKQRVAAGEELIPAEVTFAILDGENPLRVWRKHRRLTLQQLAHEADISKPYLSQLESGKRIGSTDVLHRLATALNVSLEDIINYSEE